MKRTRFTDEQIIGILKEHEAGTPVSELCRKHGVSDASIYKWKAKFGGMDVSEAKRLKTLEDENTKLKRLLAPQSPFCHIFPRSEKRPGTLCRYRQVCTSLRLLA